MHESSLIAPFAGWFVCPNCDREWPVDLEDKATPVCVCDEDTLSNYARRTDDAA